MQQRRPLAYARNPSLALVGALALLAGASACRPNEQVDPGPADSGNGSDGGQTSDGGDDPDAGTDGECLGASVVGSWSAPFFFADSEITYEADASNGAKLRLGFARFSDVFVGEFPLGPNGTDGVPGQCSHCVSLESEGVSMFAQGGTLKLEVNPFLRRLRGSLKGAWFREVDSQSENPPCVALADIEFDAAVPDAAWTCEREAWFEGQTCDCGCGVWDPDCDDAARPSTCTGGKVCAVGNPPDRSPFDPRIGECLEPCEDGSCTTGTCVPTWDFKQVCVTDETQIISVGLGEACPAPNGRYLYCNVVGGKAEGLCNYDPAVPSENACHAICSSGENTCGECRFCLGAFFDLDDTPEIGPEDPFVGSCEKL